MARYTGIPCPVCGKPFEDEDDIVVCPDCGTPHHRECFLKNGACANEGEHGSGKTWQPPRQENGPDFAAEELLRCPRCGTQISPGQEICEVCGTPVRRRRAGDDPLEEDPHGTPPTYGGQPREEGEGPVFREIPLNPFMSPFGGLSPEDTIDGVPVPEIAMFVGTNSHYYLPRFKAMEQGISGGGFSWSGFVINFIYFLYRKVYLFAVISVLISLCLTLPTSYFVARAYGEVLEETGFSLSAEEPATEEEAQRQMLALDELLTQVTRTESYATAVRVQSVTSFLSFGAALFFAFSANRIYKGHVLRTIRSLKAKYPKEQEYKAMLVKKGGVNKLGVVLLLVGYLVVNLLSTMLPALFF